MSQGSHLDALLAPGALSIVFQPIFEVGHGAPRLRGVEALTRGPAGTNMQSALVLFEYVRRKGREAEVDRACLRAILSAVEPLRALDKLPSLSCNVHASTLERDPDFGAFVEDTVRACRWPLDRLVLELVEHAPFWAGPRFTQELERLRALGVRLALDDIGLGQSNFRMILECRPDLLKLDAFLVRGCHEDERRQAILESLAGLAGRLGSPLVAEGVEAQEELDTLVRLGIERAQGYLLARPLEAEALARAPFASGACA